MVQLEPDLSGTVDLHVHYGPDRRRYLVNAIEAGQQAAAAGYAAIVLKSHSLPTAQLAWAVDQITEGTRVFGAVTCDNPVGGLNPDAVATSLHAGAKIVWLPTLSSQQDVENGIPARLGRPRERGICLLDDEGRLVPAVLQIMDLVAGHGAVLATGHVSAAEHFAVAREFGRRGKLVISHVMEGLAGPNLGIGAAVALADLGGIVEFSALTCIGTMATRTPAEIAAGVKAVGAERCFLSGDLGQNNGNPGPVEGMALLRRELLAAGLPPGDIAAMVSTVPAGLLDL
jgi:Family of unknown function (DUF6282)